MELKFRKLKADEIECRVQSIKSTGLVLLLYKDARVDQNILDETVGAMNWQRKHTRDNANCIVSIYDDDKKMWVEKEDTGTESNTEKEKGLASDSFKRACFNWGIGRELYSAPFIWIDSKDCNIESSNGAFKCNDKFSVKEITYKENGDIDTLSIYNEKLKRVVFGKGYTKPTTSATSTKKFITEEQKARFKQLGIEDNKACNYCKVNSIDEILEEKARKMIADKEEALAKGAK